MNIFQIEMGRKEDRIWIFFKKIESDGKIWMFKKQGKWHSSIGN